MLNVNGFFAKDLLKLVNRGNVPEFGYWIVDAGCLMAGCLILDTGSRVNAKARQFPAIPL